MYITLYVTVVEKISFIAVAGKWHIRQDSMISSFKFEIFFLIFLQWNFSNYYQIIPFFKYFFQLLYSMSVFVLWLFFIS